jgi:hypothetical protein
MSAVTRDILWARLRDAALVEGDVPERGEKRSPWFVRVMLGFAGWIGALFLFAFVGVGFVYVMKTPAVALVLGACACGGAAVLFRASRGDFAAQFGLAVSLAGQALMAFALFEWFSRSLSAMALAVALQQAVLFALVPNFVHRVWTAFTALFAAQFALGHFGFYAFVPPLVVAGFVAVWLREFDYEERGHLLRPLGYGLALACFQAAILQGGSVFELMRWDGGVPDLAALKVNMRVGAAASGFVLLGAMAALLRREGVSLISGPGKIALAAAAILAIASFWAPGVGLALAILVVGFANGNRVLIGLGILALLGYLSRYYYSLHATLLEKSVLLACTGLALLAVRFALHRWWPLSKDDAHA